jgi:hypothetical protein
VAALCLLLLLPATLATPLLFGKPDRAPLDRLSSASAILMDTVGPGQLPRFLWAVPGDTPVFAGTQRQVLADPQAWSSRMGADGYYGAFMGNGNDHRERWQILGILGLRYQVRRLFKSPTANLYEVTPRR